MTKSGMYKTHARRAPLPCRPWRARRSRPPARDRAAHEADGSLHPHLGGCAGSEPRRLRERGAAGRPAPISPATLLAGRVDVATVKSAPPPRGAGRGPHHVAGRLDHHREPATVARAMRQLRAGEDPSAVDGEGSMLLAGDLVGDTADDRRGPRPRCPCRRRGCRCHRGVDAAANARSWARRRGRVVSTTSVVSQEQGLGTP